MSGLKIHGVKNFVISRIFDIERRFEIRNQHLLTLVIVISSDMRNKWSTGGLAYTLGAPLS